MADPVLTTRIRAIFLHHESRVTIGDAARMPGWTRAELNAAIRFINRTKEQTMNPSTFPFVEVLSYETGLPVKIVVWHVRSVRPIREMVEDNETVTRIEFTNGDALDTTDSVPEVVERLSNALAPVTVTFASAGR